MNSYYLASLVFFSLWDYYIPFLGGRVFDYIGIVLIIVYVGSRFIRPDFGVLKFTRAYLLLLMTMFPLVVLAYLDGGWLTATAFLLGSTLVYGFFSSARYNLDRLHKQIGYLILFNLLFFYFQYAAYKLLGVVVDYHSVFGVLHPRIFNEDLSFFRAAGLFQEPNSFSVTLFMLNVARVLLRNEKPDMLFFGSLLALVLSESLWGVGATLILALFAVGLLKPSVAKCSLLAGFGSLVSLSFVILVIWPDLLGLLISPVTVWRLANLLGFAVKPLTAGHIGNIESDASVEGRYGTGFTDIDFDVPLMFGHSLTTSEFQSFSGANAIGFYIYSFGLLGMLFFVAWLVIDLKKHRSWAVGAVLFAMTSYPIFTYAFWWAWLAILIRSSDLGKHISGAPDGLRIALPKYRSASHLLVK